MSAQIYDSMLVARDLIHNWANKTFPDRVPQASLSKLVMEEIPELLVAKKEGKPLEGEMADCFILLLDLCAIWGIDPGQAIADKMDINRSRFWERDEATGFYNHTGEKL